MKIFSPPDIAKILKLLIEVEKQQPNVSTKFPKTKFINESLKTFFNLKKKRRGNHVKIKRVIVQADNKLVVHIILSAEI